MIGRLYSATVANEASTTAKTLVEIAAAADMIVTLERMWISQTDFDTSENLGAKVEGVATAGTGTAFTAPTPAPLQAGDSASTATVVTDFTIEPTYDGQVYVSQGFNVLSGWLWTPANDDEVIVVSPSQIVAFMHDVDASGAMNFSYGLVYREIGG